MTRGTIFLAIFLGVIQQPTQLPKTEAYALVLNDAKSWHLEQSLFAGRQTYLCNRLLTPYRQGLLRAYRFEYQQDIATALLDTLRQQGIIDSTCSPLNQAGEWNEGHDRLLLSITELEERSDGDLYCQVLVRAPYRTDRGRRGYFVLAEYHLTQQDSKIVLVERQVLIIT